VYREMDFEANVHKAVATIPSLGLPCSRLAKTKAGKRSRHMCLFDEV